MTIAENLINWIAALRSGKYAQAKRTLKRKNKDTYCCLGVMCDISNRGDWKDEGFFLSEAPNRVYLNSPPFEVYGKFGIRDDFGVRDLMVMNDSGNTFREIANYLEKEILPKHEN